MRSVVTILFLVGCGGPTLSVFQLAGGAVTMSIIQLDNKTKLYSTKNI